MSPAPEDPEIAAFLTFAERLADAARAAILPYFRSAPAVDNKAAAGFDPVTAADRDAETIIRTMIASTFPDHGVKGEEFADRPARGPYTWVIDPVDGTRGFIAGLPLWGCLIALTCEGAPLIGVLDQGYLRERWLGWPGGAAFHGPAGSGPLSSRRGAGLADAILSTTDPALFAEAERPAFEAVRARAKLTRLGCDCYAYGLLASGHIDLVIESGLKPHDILALIPIIEGAGGVVTTWRGEPAWAGGQVIAAGDHTMHGEALALLRASNG